MKSKKERIAIACSIGVALLLWCGGVVQILVKQDQNNYLHALSNPPSYDVVETQISHKYFVSVTVTNMEKKDDYAKYTIIFDGSLRYAQYKLETYAGDVLPYYKWELEEIYYESSIN